VAGVIWWYLTKCDLFLKVLVVWRAGVGMLVVRGASCKTGSNLRG
jgi:hypothetical protein